MKRKIKFIKFQLFNKIFFETVRKSKNKYSTAIFQCPKCGRFSALIVPCFSKQNFDSKNVSNYCYALVCLNCDSIIKKTEVKVPKFILPFKLRIDLQRKIKGLYEDCKTRYKER